MSDQLPIVNFSRHQQPDGRILFRVADTSILAEEWEDVDGAIHLRPVSGARVDSGRWHDLDESEVAACCELLEDELRRSN